MSHGGRVGNDSSRLELRTQKQGQEGRLERSPHLHLPIGEGWGPHILSGPELKLCFKKKKDTGHIGSGPPRHALQDLEAWEPGSLGTEWCAPPCMFASPRERETQPGGHFHTGRTCENTCFKLTVKSQILLNSSMALYIIVRGTFYF